MRIDVSLVFAPADREAAAKVAHRLEEAAQVRAWLEQVSDPVNETWDRGMSSAGVILLLSPDSVPGRVERTDWAELLAHTGPPPVARLLVRPCKYPALLERTAFFRWSDRDVLRDLHRWAIKLHGDYGHQPPPATYHGSTEDLWLRLADRPGILRVHDRAQARQFAHEAADHFRDVIVVRCAGRSMPMIAGELALALGVRLRGNLEEACEQIASALADARVLVLLEGLDSEAPFVREGQASVLYAPAGDLDSVPPVSVMSDAFVQWPARIDECARYVAHVEPAIGQAEWGEAARMGRAAFAFLRAHERLFEAAHIATVLLRRAEAHGDRETSSWADDELSWIMGGDRVRAPKPPVEQLSLSFA